MLSKSYFVSVFFFFFIYFLVVIESGDVQIVLERGSDKIKKRDYSALLSIN